MRIKKKTQTEKFRIADLRRKADQGNADAQYSVEMMYGAGQGVPKDYAMARQWWEKAAAQGKREGGAVQPRVPVCLGTGQGVPQDYAMARQWYEKADAQGDAEAAYSLGVLHQEGHGLPQYTDTAKANRCSQKAAERGRIPQRILRSLNENTMARSSVSRRRQK